MSEVDEKQEIKLQQPNQKFVYFQYCDKAVSKGYTGFVAKLEGRSTQSGMFESDSVTIQVKKGWEVSFDKHPAKV